jgi:RNA polymerase sigma-70 factor (ECF subfamily)
VCDEERLLTGARRFDSSALAQIHDCFYKPIYRYLRYRIDDDQVAEDAASEVFLRLLDALQDGKAPRKSLRGWLFGTASHVVNDHFRRRYRVQNDDLADHEALPASAETDPEHQLQLNLTHARLRAVLADLTPEQQQVVTLRFGQGMSHREVAQILDKSEGAVKLLQFRALRALRRLLEPATGQGARDD